MKLNKHNLKREFGEGKGSNDKDSFLSPEDVVIGEPYPFSYNPISQPDEREVLAMKAFFDQEQRFFKQRTGSEYVLNLEISSKGRWHFHGMVILKDIIKFYNEDVKQLMIFGSSCMKKASDYKGLTMKGIRAVEHGVDHEVALGIAQEGAQDEDEDIEHPWTTYCAKQQDFIQTYLHRELYSIFDKNQPIHIQIDTTSTP